MTIIDNLSRRAIDLELGTASLNPIASMADRLSAWRAVSGQEIGFLNIDIAGDYQALSAALGEINPDAIVHFAEQRSAPYSMMSIPARRYTVNNNVSATHNVLCALVENQLAAHLVHLGSIGVYGYSDAGLQLPEGYLDITAHGPDGREVKKQVLYPGDPVSLYHMTKAQDQLLFAFYARKHGCRITDLYQGIVWGTQTEETRLDPQLANRFDYDPVYGTVVNRFLVQAAIGHPLTVYGTGEQTRAYIHLQDTIRYIWLSLQSAPVAGARVQVINQITETLSVRALANMVSDLTGAMVSYIVNPRDEPASNAFDVDRTSLAALGQAPKQFHTALNAEAAFVADMDLAGLDRSKLVPANARETQTASPSPA